MNCRLFLISGHAR